MCEACPSLLCVVGLPLLLFLMTKSSPTIKIKLPKTQAKGLQHSLGKIWAHPAAGTFGGNGVSKPWCLVGREVVSSSDVTHFGADRAAHCFWLFSRWVAVHLGNSPALYYWGDSLHCGHCRWTIGGNCHLVPAPCPESRLLCLGEQGLAGCFREGLKGVLSDGTFSTAFSLSCLHPILPLHVQ